MKLKCLAVLVVLLLSSAFSFADSLDNFAFANTSGYSYSFQFPASSDFTGTNNQPPGAFGVSGMSILVNGPLPIDGYSSDSFDVFFESPTWVDISCNFGPSDCFLIRGGFFTSALYSGTAVMPTFNLGNYISTDGKTTLTITQVPDATETSLIAISLLALLGAFMVRKFSRKKLVVL